MDKNDCYSSNCNVYVLFLGKFEELGTAFLETVLENSKLYVGLSGYYAFLLKYFGVVDDTYDYVHSKDRENIIRGVLAFEDLMQRIDEYCPDLKLVIEPTVKVID